MRLFLAIDFNELSDYFKELQNKLPKNGRLSLSRTFHLTLKFLGDVQPDAADNILSTLKVIKFTKFTVFLDSIGVFPNENHIRVVWVDLKPQDRILKLQHQIDESLRLLFKQDKDFKAHITLARVKYPEDKKSFIEHLRKIEVQNKKIEIGQFKLIKSTLTQKSPVYEDLAVYHYSN